jgi:hypothetical protein
MTTYTGATIDGFDDYFEARGVERPATMTDEIVTAALLVATEWIDSVYGPSFIGYKTGGFRQSREWPRTMAVVDTFPYFAFPTDEIPDQLINAVYEAAWRHASTPGSLLADYTPAKYKSVSIDGAVSVEYAAFNSASEIQKSFPRIDQLLSDLLDSGKSVSSYSGATSRA